MHSDAFSLLPELHQHSQLIRIPGELDVPITKRVRAVIDAAAFQRLKHISQLGLVSHVYPGMRCTVASSIRWGFIDWRALP